MKACVEVRNFAMSRGFGYWCVDCSVGDLREPLEALARGRVMGLRPLHALFTVGIAAGLVAPHEALACGGTFCDQPPPGQQPMPVDQSGENIVFRISGGYVEAHIQIQYTGNPRRFAWLIPVPAVPTVSVGSELLFRSLLAATVPTVQLSTSFSCNGVNMGGCGMGSAATADRASSGEPPTTSPVETQLIGTAVGAFDVSIVQPTSAADVTTWLENNGFIVGTEAPAIVSDYVALGHVFVAVKLLPDADSDEIHPLVIRYAGDKPCIPLKLTAVAAVPDMGVRAFFLGDSRVVPSNYREVTLNPAALDWTNPGANYADLVSRAVDTKGADGHAFVPEYAGPSSIVSTSSVYDPRWNADPFRTIARDSVVTELAQEGLLSCAYPGCTANHPLVMPLLSKYLPGSVAPDGTLADPSASGSGAPCAPADAGAHAADAGAEPDASGDAGSSACAAGDAGASTWDAIQFATELDDRIVQPAKHAADLLASSSYLTRLFTAISPEEMTDDPEFVTSPTSTQTVNPRLSTSETFDCRGTGEVQIPGHSALVLQRGQSWPVISGMPAAETIVGYDSGGHTVLIADERESIEGTIGTWNAAQPSLDFGDSGRGTCGCSVPGGSRMPPLVTSAIVAIVLAARRRSKRKRG